MKNLVLITVFLVVATIKLMAQEKSAIEVKNIEKQSFGAINTDANISEKENNQFQIVANENVDVNLKFNLKKKVI
jgi:hypothetical protein